MSKRFFHRVLHQENKNVFILLSVSKIFFILVSIFLPRVVSFRLVILSQKDLFTDETAYF